MDHLTETRTREVAGLPYLRPLSHPDEIAEMLAEYPVVVACGCTGILESSTHMVRDTAMDAIGDTARGRYLRGCNEVFRCPACGAVQLFPAPGSDTREDDPAWGSLRGWPEVA